MMKMNTITDMKMITSKIFQKNIMRRTMKMKLNNWRMKPSTIINQLN